MKKAKLYYIVTILTIVLIILSTYSYAVDITKENLKEAFDKISRTAENLNDTIEVTDDEIIFNIENDEGKAVQYKMQYDLTKKPTFSTDVIFEKGMTYDECNGKSDEISILMFGFIASANINKIEPEDSLSYVFSKILSQSAVQSVLQSENSTISKENFIDGIEFAKAMYSTDYIINDELFTMTISKGEQVQDQYVVKSKLVVNSEKDFSVLKGKADELGNTMVNSMFGGITNTIPNAVTQNANTTSTPSTVNITTIPNAGFDINILTMLKIILGLGIASIIVYLVYNKRYSGK